MKLIDSLTRHVARFFRRPSLEELEEEFSSHIWRRADDLERSGLSRAEAERQARIEFGSRGRFREECYEALGSHFLETVIQDVRFSLRLLRKSWGFTVIAILTLALAIGANAVAFGALNGLILRPLNLPRAESLYGLQRVSHKTPMQSYPDYRDLRERNRSFEDLAAFNIAEAGLDTGQNPSRVRLQMVSGNYFDVLGIQPFLGRLLHGSDEHGPNSAPYIVLSYAYWSSHFEEDRNVVGRVVYLNKHPYTVIGVTPAEFHGTLIYLSPDLFAPLVNQLQFSGTNLLDQRGRNSIAMVVGHLKAGVTPAQATADLDSIGAYLERTYPEESGQMTFSLVSPALYGDLFGPPVRAFATGLLLLTGLILLAACANLGSLFAARSTDRSREVALRLALGSGRRRILQQMFTEAALLSVAGATIGLLGSIWLLSWLSVWQPISRLPGFHIPVQPDAKVYALAFVLALVSPIFFSIVPMRHVFCIDSYQIVKSGSAAIPGRRMTVRDVLLAVQIAICAVLVTSSLVAMRGLMRSLRGSFGLEPQNVVLVNTDLTMAGYSEDSVSGMQRRMIDAVLAIGGVESAGFADRLPLVGGNFSKFGVFAETATDLRLSNATGMSLLWKVSPGYFETAGTRLLAGRTFTWHDDQDAPRVAVVNREFARKVFGSPASAVDRSYKLREGTRIHVIGVIEDGKYNSVTESTDAAMFFPSLQSPSGPTWLVVRSRRNTEQLVSALREKLQPLDRGLPLSIDTWTRAMDLALFPMFMATLSLIVLAAMGAILSITGLFGMAAYSVSKRLKELGIRIALGGQRKEVLQAALGRALKLLAGGSAAGLLVGVFAARVLAHIVYQATPQDPFVLAGVVLAMASLGLLATWIPARRALSLDPAKLLREE